jgi:hypothetical protein
MEKNAKTKQENYISVRNKEKIQHTAHTEGVCNGGILVYIYIYIYI